MSTRGTEAGSQAARRNTRAKQSQGQKLEEHRRGAELQLPARKQHPDPVPNDTDAGEARPRTRAISRERGAELARPSHHRVSLGTILDHGDLRRMGVEENIKQKGERE